MRAGDDLAVRRLPEHFREAHGRHDAALDQVMKNCARPNGRKLVYVADKNQPGEIQNSPHQRLRQRPTHHGRSRLRRDRRQASRTRAG